MQQMGGEAETAAAATKTDELHPEFQTRNLANNSTTPDRTIGRAAVDDDGDATAKPPPALPLGGRRRLPSMQQRTNSTGRPGPQRRGSAIVQHMPETITTG